MPVLDEKSFQSERKFKFVAALAHTRADPVI